MDFAMRGLEIHSSRMWRWQSVARALEVMERIGLNTLIFHQNDLIDELVRPSAYFSWELMRARWPVRMHRLDNNKQYIRKIVREAGRKGIRFLLEVKEIWYPEALLELYPHLRRPDGSICPTDPFWWEFLRQKMVELLAAVPEIAGVIVSPATMETKVSISSNTCTCARCRGADPVAWYAMLLRTMYEPLREQGKLLAVRDFAYSAAEQDLVIKSAAQVSDAVVMALKNTPHDFYPTFPNNPRIGHTGGQPQWVEFDTWGQFFGMGTFPCSVVEDMQQRLRHCRESGVTGVWFRTDWEGMLESSAFNSLNLLNVFGGGLFSQDVDANIDGVYRAWLDYGLLSPMRTESCQGDPVRPGPGALEPLRAFMRASWRVIEKALFVRGHLFHEDGMFLDTIQRAFDTMTKVHGRDDWDPGASGRVEPTAENVAIILAEKEQARQEVTRLLEILRVDTLDLPDDLAAELETMLELYRHYVEGFYHCAAVCFLTRLAVRAGAAGDAGQAEEAIDGLEAYRAETIRLLEGTSYPHYVYWFLDEERLGHLAADARWELEGGVTSTEDRLELADNKTIIV